MVLAHVLKGLVPQHLALVTLASVVLHALQTLTTALEALVLAMVRALRE